VAIVADTNGEVSPIKIVDIIEGIGIKIDIVIVEGFSKVLGKDKNIYKIIIVENEGDLRYYLNIVTPPILAIVSSKIKKAKYKVFDPKNIELLICEIRDKLKEENM